MCMYGVILLDNFSDVNAKLILSVLCTFPISWIFLNISNSWTLVCIRFTWWFIKIQISGPHPQISDSIGIKWNLKMFISNTSLCDANAPGLGTTLWGWLIYMTLHWCFIPPRTSWSLLGAHCLLHTRTTP